MMDHLESEIRNNLQIGPSRYWSRMDRFQRKSALEYFSKNGGVMLAIKCLDEGVDIPAISHGIVLASSKTKREFIQRRGRLLRKTDGKDMAYIFDTFALPSEAGEECDFVLDELRRGSEFAENANNREEVRADLEILKIEYDVSNDDLICDSESEPAAETNVAESAYNHE